MLVHTSEVTICGQMNDAQSENTIKRLKTNEPVKPMCPCLVSSCHGGSLVLGTGGLAGVQLCVGAWPSATAKHTSPTTTTTTTSTQKYLLKKRNKISKTKK